MYYHNKVWYYQIALLGDYHCAGNHVSSHTVFLWKWILLHFQSRHCLHIHTAWLGLSLNLSVLFHNILSNSKSTQQKRVSLDLLSNLIMLLSCDLKIFFFFISLSICFHYYLVTPNASQKARVDNAFDNTIHIKSHETIKNFTQRTELHEFKK